MPFVAGETIGPYQVLEQLGQGGMATVFKAYHPSLDRYVAIKALHPAFMEDPNFLARFQREARVVAKLEHPNIVPIYDFAEHQGRPYLVMKYVEGETLKARLGRGKLDWAEVVRVTEAIGAALSYAHRAGILHRDIKPSNVLLTKDGQIYLADFGLARIAAAGESTLSSDMLVGTPQYISPEQAKGNHNLDEGTDIYSFGVLLYELVVGRVPFTADTPYSIIHDHIYSPLPPPRSVNPNVPEAVERVLLKALAKERSNRYDTVAVLVEAFNGALALELSAADTAAMPPTKPALKAVMDRPSSISTSETLAVGAAQKPIPYPQVDSAAEQPPASQPPLAPEVSRPAAAPTHQPVSALPDAPHTSVRRHRRGWWKIALPAALALFCLCVFMAIWADRADDVVVGVEIQPPPVPNAVDAARQFVDLNPQDPQAHYNLAMVLADDGQDVAAMGEYRQALDLAGENYDFYMHVGRDLSGRGLWPQAAIAYLRLAQVHPAPLPPEMGDALHESLYEAANAPDFLNIISLDEITAYNETLGGVVRARYDLFNEGPVRAQGRIGVILERNQENLDARLVQAEIFIHTGAIDRARAVLDGLLHEENLPDWIRLRAQSFFDQTQP